MRTKDNFFAILNEGIAKTIEIGGLPVPLPPDATKPIGMDYMNLFEKEMDKKISRLAGNFWESEDARGLPPLVGGNSCRRLKNIFFSDDFLYLCSLFNGNNPTYNMMHQFKLNIYSMEEKIRNNVSAEELAGYMSLYFNAFSYAGAEAYIAAYKNDKSNRLGAIEAGIIKIGINTLHDMLREIIYSFNDIAQNNKRLWGLILNNTPHNIIVTNWEDDFDDYHGGSLYMKHGRMAAFFKDGPYEGKLYKLNPEILPRPASTDGCYGGMYAMVKRDHASYGVESTMRLDVCKQRTNVRQYIYFLAACPYSQNNRVNLCCVNPEEPDAGKKASDKHDHLYNNGAVIKTNSDGKEVNFIRASVDSSSGSDTHSLCVISPTK